jgi:protein TonB
VVAGLLLQPKPTPGPEGPVVVVQLIGRLPSDAAATSDQHDEARQPMAKTAKAAGQGPGAPQAPAASAADGAAPMTVQAQSAAAAAPSGLQGQDELHYQDVLLAYITRFRAYPDAARPARLIGRVLVRFAMSREGKVLDVWVDQSSGQSILDDAAKSTVLRAQPLPPIPAGLPSVLTLSLPVDFSPPGPV